MTDQFRALCANLTAALNDWQCETGDDRYEGLIDRARAALADEPAVPEGREPVAVTGQPSDEELARLWFETDGREVLGAKEIGKRAKYARAVLARWGNPAPQPPAEGEVAELVRMLTGIAHWRRRGRPGEGDPSPFDIRQADRLDRAADLLQRLSPPQPVPVAERLPGPEDCAPWPGEPNAGRWCWMASCVDNGWAWEQRTLGFLASFPQDFTHWLPAHALPLPGQEVEP